jgi:hypothetical protein
LKKCTCDGTRAAVVDRVSGRTKLVVERKQRWRDNIMKRRPIMTPPLD